jgi:decaprenyl-phosphate phosphoribosyltransferase
VADHDHHPPVAGNDFQQAEKPVSRFAKYPRLQLIRPHQWVKNLFVFAPLVFSLQMTHTAQLFNALLAFVAFTLAASVGYIVNDLRDVEADRLHSKKQHRPIASGKVSAAAATRLAAALLVALVLLMLLLPLAADITIALYFFLMLAYSQWLKHIAIVDVMVIASGFVMRLLAGGYATGIDVSPWMIQVTFLLSLFLGFSKRYHEITSDTGRTTRRSLTHYSSAFLDRLMSISCGATLLSYAMYAVDTAAKLQRTAFVYSSAFVAFGLFRYLQQVYLFRRGGAPESALYHDRLFLANIVAWLLFCVWQISASGQS